MNDDYTKSLEKLMESIDIAIKDRINQIKFDKTEICTIVQQDDNDKSKYMVSNEAGLTFEAKTIEENKLYYTDQKVYVTVIQGDYSLEKIILGTYNANNEKSKKTLYSTPFENFIIRNSIVFDNNGSVLDISSLNASTNQTDYYFDKNNYDYIGLEFTANTYGKTDFHQFYVNVKLKENANAVNPLLSFKFSSDQIVGNPKNLIKELKNQILISVPNDFNAALQNISIIELEVLVKDSNGNAIASQDISDYIDFYNITLYFGYSLKSIDKIPNKVNLNLIKSINLNEASEIQSEYGYIDNKNTKLIGIEWYDETNKIIYNQNQISNHSSAIYPIKNIPTVYFFQYIVGKSKNLQQYDIRDSGAYWITIGKGQIENSAGQGYITTNQIFIPNSDSESINIISDKEKCLNKASTLLKAGLKYDNGEYIESKYITFVNEDENYQKADITEGVLTFRKGSDNQDDNFIHANYSTDNKLITNKLNPSFSIQANYSTQWDNNAWVVWKIPKTGTMLTKPNDSWEDGNNITWADGVSNWLTEKDFLTPGFWIYRSSNTKPVSSTNNNAQVDIDDAHTVYYSINKQYSPSMTNNTIYCMIRTQADNKDITYKGNQRISFGSKGAAGTNYSFNIEPTRMGGLLEENDSLTFKTIFMDEKNNIVAKDNIKYYLYDNNKEIEIIQYDNSLIDNIKIIHRIQTETSPGVQEESYEEFDTNEYINGYINLDENIEDGDRNMFQDDYISILSLITEDDAHNAICNVDAVAQQDVYEIETENLHFKFLLDQHDESSNNWHIILLKCVIKNSNDNKKYYIPNKLYFYTDIDDNTYWTISNIDTADEQYNITILGDGINSVFSDGGETINNNIGYLKIPDTVTILSSQCFSNCQLCSLFIPYSIQKIQNNCFPQFDSYFPLYSVCFIGYEEIEDWESEHSDSQNFYSQCSFLVCINETPTENIDGNYKWQADLENNNEITIYSSYLKGFDKSSIYLKAETDFTIQNIDIKTNQAKSSSIVFSAFSPISIAANTGEEGKRYFIEGASKVIYNSSGVSPDWDNEYAYKLYKGNNNTIEEVTTVSSKKVLWKIIYPDMNSVDLNNYPQLTPDYSQSTENITYYKLSPKSTYSEKYSTCSIKAYYETIVSGNIIQNTLYIQPILILQNSYAFPLLNEWDGATVIDQDNGKIMSQLVGAGKKNMDNTYTGVLMGDIQKIGNNYMYFGLYGLQNDNLRFKLDETGAFYVGTKNDNFISFNENINGRSDKNELMIKTQNFDLNTDTLKITSNKKGLIEILNNNKQNIVEIGTFNFFSENEKQGINIYNGALQIYKNPKPNTIILDTNEINNNNLIPYNYYIIPQTIQTYQLYKVGQNGIEIVDEDKDKVYIIMQNPSSNNNKIQIAHGSFYEKPLYAPAYQSHYLPPINLGEPSFITPIYITYSLNPSGTGETQQETVEINSYNTSFYGFTMEYLNNKWVVGGRYCFDTTSNKYKDIYSTTTKEARDIPSNKFTIFNEDLGEYKFSTDPERPEKYDTYYNTTYKQCYIYDNTWVDLYNSNILLATKSYILYQTDINKQLIEIKHIFDKNNPKIIFENPIFNFDTQTGGIISNYIAYKQNKFECSLFKPPPGGQGEDVMVFYGTGIYDINSQFRTGLFDSKRAEYYCELSNYGKLLGFTGPFVNENTEISWGGEIIKVKDELKKTHPFLDERASTLKLGSQLSFVADRTGVFPNDNINFINFIRSGGSSPNKLVLEHWIGSTRYNSITMRKSLQSDYGVIELNPDGANGCVVIRIGTTSYKLGFSNGHVIYTII